MSDQRQYFSFSRLFSRLPIARKLVTIVTATTISALLILSLSIVAYDGWTARRSLQREVEIMGQIVADRSMAALSFGDARSAAETLDALSARPSILQATLYSADAEVLARFRRSPQHDDDMTAESPLPEDGIRFIGDRLQLVRTIFMEGEAIGRVVLVSDLREIRERQTRILAIASGAAILSFFIAFFLSGYLRRGVASSVVSLAAAARRVTNERDYSSRVSKSSEDELGDLVTSFNEMLEEIARREVALRAERDRAEDHAARERELFEETSQAKQELEAQILERERLEEQILHAQKMEAVGRLAGGIAHDFNNMLMVIRGYTEASLRDPDCSERLREYLTEIDLASQRAHATTKQLLIFSRQQVLKVETIEMNNCIRETLNMLERLIGEDVELRAELTDADLFVRGDTGQIQQLLVNLAVNARDAMPTGGCLTIATRAYEVDPGAVSEELQLAPGKYAALEVRDTGMGIPLDVQPKVFDPFYTTKPAGKGTGLGLSSVYGLVRMSGGAIRLESEDGEGASFEIFLPLTAPPSPEAEGADRISRARGSETILLVEDERPVRRLVKRILDQHGYRVFEAENGLEALDVSRSHEGPIDLVITDVVMPKMNAGELIERLEQERPDTPVLLMSGYLDDAIGRYGIEVQRNQLLDKPFSEDELLSKVRGLLDEDRD